MPSTWEVILSEFADTKRSDLVAPRVLIVGNRHSGKRTLSARLREEIAAAERGGHSGAHTAHAAGSRVGGVDHSLFTYTVHTDDEDARHTAEMFCVDSEAELAIMLSSRDAATKTIVLVACDMRYPVSAPDHATRWIEAVQSCVAKFHTNDAPFASAFASPVSQVCEVAEGRGDDTTQPVVPIVVVATKADLLSKSIATKHSTDTTLKHQQIFVAAELRKAGMKYGAGVVFASAAPTTPAKESGLAALSDYVDHLLKSDNSEVPATVAAYASLFNRETPVLQYLFIPCGVDSALELQAWFKFYNLSDGHGRFTTETKLADVLPASAYRAEGRPPLPPVEVTPPDLQAWLRENSKATSTSPAPGAAKARLGSESPGAAGSGSGGSAGGGGTTLDVAQAQQFFNQVLALSSGSSKKKERK